jgi:hypothetical protein
LKKCPGCGSIEADEDTICGVCGYDLRDISPMQESIDESVAEDATKDAEEDRRLEKQDIQKTRKQWVTGAIVGSSMLILGFWLLFSTLQQQPLDVSKPSIALGILIGVFLIAFGIITLETLFDLYEGAPYHGWYWFGWIGRR